MINTNDFDKAIDLLTKSRNILITTHIRPDGDACGCMTALSQSLTTMGKQVKSLLLSSSPKWYDFLFIEKPPILGENLTTEQLIQGELIQPDLIIIVDTNSITQLPRFDKYIHSKDIPILVIDHHATSDNLGNVQLIDSTAAATTIIVFDLFVYAGWKISKKIADAFFVGLSTDTGWFQFSNTDSRTHRIAADLIDAGVKPAEIYRAMYLNFSPERFKLMTKMLNTLELHFDGRYADQHITSNDFKETGAKRDETENLIDQCRAITTIEAAALFTELADGRIKCSLRSSGNIDVKNIAEKFDGGGHISASGAYLPGPIENAKKLIKEEIKKQLA